MFPDVSLHNVVFTLDAYSCTFEALAGRCKPSFRLVLVHTPLQRYASSLESVSLLSS